MTSMVAVCAPAHKTQVVYYAELKLSVWLVGRAEEQPQCAGGGALSGVAED